MPFKGPGPDQTLVVVTNINNRGREEIVDIQTAATNAFYDEFHSRTFDTRERNNIVSFGWTLVGTVVNTYMLEGDLMKAKVIHYMYESINT